MEFAQGVGRFNQEDQTRMSIAILEGAELAGARPSMLGDWWLQGGGGIPCKGGVFFEIEWPEGMKTYQVRMDATAQDIADAIKS